MAILWCGGEDIDFPNGNATVPTTTATYFNSGYARLALAMTNTADKQGARSKAFAGGAITNGWFHATIYRRNTGYTSLPICGLGKAGTTHGIWVGSTGTADKLGLFKYDGTNFTQLAAESGSSMNPGAKHTIDIEVIDFGADATINVYLDGGSSPLITYTGDVTTGSMSDLDCAILHGASNSNDSWISEVVVADSDTRTFKLVTLAPNAAGDTNEWTGAYTDIDETTLSDADLVYTDAAAQTFQCNLTATPAGSFTVDAIKIAARATKTGDASVGTLKLGVKSDGSEDLDAGQALTTSWVTYERLAATINGAQLTTALLDALQLQLESAA